VVPPLVECARTYGWRKSELLNLRVKQVDLTDRSERLEPGTTKNREGRVVTITNAVFVLLTACVQGKQPVDHASSPAPMASGCTRSPGSPA
jgi:integrase